MNFSVSLLPTSFLLLAIPFSKHTCPCWVFFFFHSLLNMPFKYPLFFNFLYFFLWFLSLLVWFLGRRFSLVHMSFCVCALFKTIPSFLIIIFSLENWVMCKRDFLADPSGWMFPSVSLKIFFDDVGRWGLVPSLHISLLSETIFVLTDEAHFSFLPLLNWVETVHVSVCLQAWVWRSCWGNALFVLVCLCVCGFVRPCTRQGRCMDECSTALWHVYFGMSSPIKSNIYNWPPFVAFWATV